MLSTVRGFFKLSLILVASIAVSSSWAASLAEDLKAELGDRPSRTRLIQALKKHMPKRLEVESGDVVIPKEYTEILYGKALADFILTAQRSNAFLHPEANQSGFMVSDSIKELHAWPYNPTHETSFFVPHFKIPAKDIGVGNFSDGDLISPDMRAHMVTGSAAKPYLNFFFHPDDVESYEDFVEGGASAPNVPKSGYGVEWNYIGIAANGPRSLFLIDLDHPERDPVVVKVSLHRKLEGSTRIIPPHKAERSVLFTRLWQENMTPALEKKWGVVFLPEFAAYTLPYAKRSIVARDPSLLTGKRGLRYVYAYSPFSPSGVNSKNDILAVQWLGRNPTKAKFEKLAREVFALMAKPFAFGALVAGFNAEWHTANWMLALNTNDELAGHVALQDAEALRYDPKIALWSGGTARSMQSISMWPWRQSKYSDALGGDYESHELSNGASADVARPEFLAEEYIWRVRGLLELEKPGDATTMHNLWGFSTIVNVVYNFGRGVMGFNVKPEEVERWMDEEMANAFNFVLRDHLKVPEAVVPSVTAEQNLREVMLMREYEALAYADNPTAKMAKKAQVYDTIHEEGGITRALWQYRNYLESQRSIDDADEDLQTLLMDEAIRLTELHRNTRKEWSDLTGTRQGYYFFFHEDARVIEVRDKKEWLGFFSLEAEDSAGTQKFFKEFKAIKGRYPRDAKVARGSGSSCREALTVKGLFDRNRSFGDKLSSKDQGGDD